MDADLVSRKRWQEEKEELLKQSQLPKLMIGSDELINGMVKNLDARLHKVSGYLEDGDNRNIILRNPKGKRLWRLPSGSKKHLVNNPFFQ